MAFTVVLLVARTRSILSGSVLRHTFFLALHIGIPPRIEHLVTFSIIVNHVISLGETPDWVTTLSDLTCDSSHIPQDSVV